jgi:toxin YoeB
MGYDVKFSETAKYHIKEFEKAGNKSALKKIDSLVEELYEHPRFGTGHPEQLKGYPNAERWARRITGKHRLIYEIKDDINLVLVASAYGHYDDK